TGKRRIGFLYAINVFGAVFGCVGAGLFLFPNLGLANTQWVAIFLNLISALGAWLIARRYPSPTLTPSPKIEESLTSVSPSLQSSALTRLSVKTVILITIYSLSGFTAMLYEISWSRILVLVLGSSTYAYTIMLTTFLFGLALGAFFGSKLKASMYSLATVGIAQLVVAITTYFSMFSVEELPYIFTQVQGSFGASPKGLLLVQFILAACLMILPTLGLGAMFPLTIRCLNPDATSTVKWVGWAYAFNTFGAIAGSLAAGFWLLPWLGSRATIVVGIFINTIAGSVAMVSDKSRLPTKLRILVIGFIGVFCLNLAISPKTWQPYIMSSGIFRYFRNYQGLNHQEFYSTIKKNRGDIVYFKEGLSATVSVTRTVRDLSLLVNGKPDASVPSNLIHPYDTPRSDELADLPTQTLLGQLPLLLAGNQQDVMVIGLGSGITLNSVLTHPVDSVECIELEKAVVDASVFFQQFCNGLVSEHPKVRMVVNDARNHLIMTDRSYDVIISEPSNPWIAGVSSLFTREFFQIVKSRLKPDGLFCQWVQLYEMDEEDFQVILRSILTVFPHAELFRVYEDALILCSLEPLLFDLNKIQTRWTDSVATDLARIKIEGPGDLLAYYRTETSILKEITGSGPINTDDNMWIEYIAPLRLQSRDLYNVRELWKHFKLNSPESLSRKIVWQNNLEKDKARFWADLAVGFDRLKQPEEAILFAEHSVRIAPNPLAAQIQTEALLKIGSINQASEVLESSLVHFRDDLSLRNLKTSILLLQQSVDAALEHARESIKIRPDDLQSQYLLGQCLYSKGDVDEALETLNSLQPAPLSREDRQRYYYMTGMLNRMSEEHQKAAANFNSFLLADPKNPAVLKKYAQSLEQIGRPEEALQQWQILATLRSKAAEDEYAKGVVSWNSNHRDKARIHFNNAISLNPNHSDATLFLVRLLRLDKNYSLATTTLARFLKINPDIPWALGFQGQILFETGDEYTSTKYFQRYQALTGEPWIPVDLEE
ncbi:MAG TPA: tetratricopeptide repeat protein, partial [Verrucomicrobiales bacterium]|nr:tetratricopeptide repeat protein [Verrucomicrobiales bacterium]